MPKISAVAAIIILSQSGCVVVGGYSNADGWFVWPGGLIITLGIVLFFLFARKRR